MSWQVEFTSDGASDFRKLDPSLQRRILRKLRWLADNFTAITPEALSGSLAGYSKFRVGSYRVIYTVDDAKKLIVVHMVGHRSEIYR
ncbi:type II toxin-antitoxin system RelE/ParE family toxin [bacterium]|nr:type II toxin-antitoxin system RelE/ParE family toxin [bacterium]